MSGHNLAPRLGKALAAARRFDTGEPLRRELEELLHLLQVPRHSRADTANREQLQALCLYIEVLDNRGNAEDEKTARDLLAGTGQALMEDAQHWPGELARTAHQPGQRDCRRLMRQRVWCGLAYALLAYRVWALERMGNVLATLEEFVNTHLATDEFPCYGTRTRMHYYLGLYHKELGDLHQADTHFTQGLLCAEQKLQQIGATSASDQTASGGPLFFRACIARILAFGPGTITFARAQYAHTVQSLVSAQAFMPAECPEHWKHAIDIYRSAARIMAVDLGASKTLSLLRAEKNRLQDNEREFAALNPRYALLARSFGLLAVMRAEQATRLQGGLSPLELADSSHVARALEDLDKFGAQPITSLSAVSLLPLLEYLLRIRHAKFEKLLDRLAEKYTAHIYAAQWCQAYRAEYYYMQGRLDHARALTGQLLSEPSINLSLQARMWALRAVCNPPVETVPREHEMSRAFESLPGLQDGFARVFVEWLKRSTTISSWELMPYQKGSKEPDWANLENNQVAARENTLRAALHPAHGGNSVATVAQLLGCSSKHVYAMLDQRKSHPDVVAFRQRCALAKKTGPDHPRS